MLEQPLLFTGCSSIQFFNSFFGNLRDTMPRQWSSLSSHFLWLTGHDAASEVITLISYNLCELRDTMLCQRLPLSFPTQPVLWNHRISLDVASVLTMYLCSHYYLIGPYYTGPYEKVKFTKDLFLKKDTWIIKKVQETEKLLQQVV